MFGSKKNILTCVGPSFPSLRVEKIKFDAGLELDVDGDLVRTGSAKYVGPPSDEIDENWEYLIRTLRL